MKSNSDSESESDWDWTRIPVEDLKESDFRRRYEDDPKAFAFVCPRFQYKNKAQINLEKDIEEYKRLSRNLSPYDAIPLPLNSGLCGNTKARPTSLTYHRPLLTHLSKLALDMYNADNQGANFEFDDLVKATRRPISGGIYYITFQAKDATTTSSNFPAKTFQAQVGNMKPGPPVVESCSIKAD
ncbi:uncharacterized protein [Cicer arietinum]|uniref:Uncharacterized protein LOC101513656 n=1 Tax=Cicer arietinum TaxID=3827 RepID=A0A1S2YW65_CICAR|nr:uncharacterized protein LOC101513656 [Cicer arietinum]